MQQLTNDLMKSIADVNVLFPLLCEGHLARPAALRWFERQSIKSVGWCLLTRLAVLRLLSNAKVMGSSVQTPDNALHAWDALQNDERMEGVDLLPEKHEEIFRSLVAKRRPDPNLWADAWLAALAESGDWELVTFDQDFQQFSLSRWQLLRVSIS
jgi:toxin-antitoxin system PIN domain toxin